MAATLFFILTILLNKYAHVKCDVIVLFLNVIG